MTHAFTTQDTAEHLTTMYLSRCERGKRCLYEGSTPPDGFPNSWVHYLCNNYFFLCIYFMLGLILTNSIP